MNIFLFDSNHKLNAQYHCDKYTVKMSLELSQLVCTAHHETGSKLEIPYRSTHKNHPCSKWARESVDNYLWVCDLADAICDEYTFRYGKIHKCKSIIAWAYENRPNLPDIGLTPFAQAMPDQYKDSNAFKAYRDYFKHEKKHLFSWKYRGVPEWLKQDL